MKELLSQDRTTISQTAGSMRRVNEEEITRIRGKARRVVERKETRTTVKRLNGITGDVQISLTEMSTYTEMVSLVAVLLFVVIFLLVAIFSTTVMLRIISSQGYALLFLGIFLFGC